MRLTALILAMGLCAAASPAAYALPSEPEAIEAAPRAAGNESSELLNEFQSLCWPHSDAPFNALADADAQHWMPIPDALMGQMTQGTPGVLAQGRIKSTSTGLFMLGVVRGPTPIVGDDFHGLDVGTTCFVMQPRGDNGSAQPTLERWLGGGRGVQVDKNYVIYAYTEDSSGKHFLSDVNNAEAKRLFNAGSLKAIMLRTDTSSTVVGILLHNR